MHVERVRIPSGTITLEGEIGKPEKFNGKIAAVICHPHPLFGGTMHNNVVSALFYTLPENGIVALRFNFRGVDGSQGEYENGIGEKEDVNSAINYLIKELSPRLKEVAVIGYSFGAWVGLSAAVENKLAKIMIAIAPPVKLFNFDYIKNVKKPKFFILGDLDDFAPLEDFLTFYEKVSPPKNYAILQGADHFFYGYELELATIVTNLLKTGVNKKK
ncbi:MAG: dienelactone hydrolase family protein [Candidatus Jordarchaeales archaeon]